MPRPLCASWTIPGSRSVADALADRRAERERMLGLAREYVRRLSSAVRVRAAWVVGSVARGDFNVWSDVDVLIVADDLPPRPLDRMEILLSVAPPGVQPVGLTRSELERERRRGNPLVVEADERGIQLSAQDAE